MVKMDSWKIDFLLGWPIFRCYLSFIEGSKVTPQAEQAIQDPKRLEQHLVRVLAQDLKRSARWMVEQGALGTIFTSFFFIFPHVSLKKQTSNFFLGDPGVLGVKDLTPRTHSMRNCLKKVKQRCFMLFRIHDLKFSKGNTS